MESQKFKEKCLKHPKQKIEFLRIVNSQSSQSKPLFCCQECFNSDSTFNLNDYQRIKYLITAGINKIIQKWPPVNNQEIIDLLMKITSEENNLDETIGKVNSFFKEFKQQINDQIDKSHKECIKYVEDHCFNQKDIVSKYQEISKINDLRSYLLNSQTNLQEKEKQCSEFILKFHSQTSENSKNLENLLIENNSKSIFASESALQIQQSILKSIENIELFKQPIPPIKKLNIELLKTDYNNGQTSLQIQLDSNQQQLVKLISLNCGYYNVVSNLILEPNKKYIFRFQLNQLKQGYSIYIGLIQDSNKNNKAGIDERLCCRFENKGQFVSKETNYGIYKQLQGDKFNLFQNKQLEFRVCIAEKTLQMLDYPDYNYKIGLDDQYIPNLTNAQNLRLFLGFYYQESQVTLTEAFITEKFD